MKHGQLFYLQPHIRTLQLKVKNKVSRCKTDLLLGFTYIFTKKLLFFLPLSFSSIENHQFHSPRNETNPSFCLKTVPSDITMHTFSTYIQILNRTIDLQGIFRVHIIQVSIILYKQAKTRISAIPAYLFLVVLVTPDFISLCLVQKHF